jgi:hypothetical protein
MTRGPYKLNTKGMDLSSRLSWWNCNGGAAPRPKASPLSIVWRKALRQEWGLG